MFAEELEPHRKTKSEPPSPYKSPVTPTSQMHTTDPKIDIHYTYLRDLSPLLRYLILLQPLKRYNRKMISCCNNWKIGKLWTLIFTMIIKSSKQRWIPFKGWLTRWPKPTATLGNNWSSIRGTRQNLHGKKEKLLKFILLNKLSHEGQFLFVCSGTCKTLGVGVMLGQWYG